MVAAFEDPDFAPKNPQFVHGQSTWRVDAGSYSEHPEENPLFSLTGQSWPLRKVTNKQKDDEIDRAIMLSDSRVFTIIRECYIPTVLSFRLRVTLCLGWGGMPDRYTCKLYKTNKWLEFRLHCNLLDLRKQTLDEMVGDISHAMVISIIDALKRRRIDTTRLTAALETSDLRPAPKTAFKNLLGDINPVSEDEELRGKEVVLSIPLAEPESGARRAARDPVASIEMYESLLRRAVEGVGTVVGHEFGSGSVEFFVSCESHAPVIESLRRMARDGEIPTTARGAAVNLDTGAERNVSLISRPR